MATIIQIGRWTTTEEVADHMVEIGLLKKCENEHIDVTEEDLPIYHISPEAPDWFGYSTMEGAIRTSAHNLEK